MRVYLRSKGVKVPDKISKGRINNSNFMVTEPDGHLVEIVQYEPDGLSVQAKGKFLDDNPAGPRISQRMSHLGIIVGALEPAMKFYGELSERTRASLRKPVRACPKATVLRCLRAP